MISIQWSWSRGCRKIVEIRCIHQSDQVAADAPKSSNEMCFHTACLPHLCPKRVTHRIAGLHGRLLQEPEIGTCDTTIYSDICWYRVRYRSSRYSPAKLARRPSLTAAPISARLGTFNIPHSGRFSTPPPIDKTSSHTIARSNRSINC